MDLKKIGLRKKQTALEAPQKSNSGSSNFARMVNPNSFGGFSGVQQLSATDKGKIPLKIYILIAISSITAVATGYLFGAGLFTYGVIGLLVFSSIFVVQTLVFKKPMAIVGVSLLDSLGLTFFLFSALPSVASCVFGILTILFILAHLSGVKTADNMLKLKFSRTVRRGVGLFLVAMAIFTGAVLFTNGGVIFAQENIARTINLIGRPLLGNKIQNFSAEMRLDSMLGEYAKSQLKEDPQFKGLSKVQQEIALSNITAGLANYIENYTHFKPLLEKTVTENVQSLIVQKTESLSSRNQLTRLALLVLVLIIAVKSLEFLFAPPLILLGLVVYELMIGFGFLEVQFETRSKEIISLS